MFSREQAQRLLDFLYVPHRLGRPGDPSTRVVRLCRDCGEGSLIEHGPGCRLADIIPVLEELTQQTVPTRSELLAFVDEVHEWMHKAAVEKPDFVHRLPRRRP